MLSMENVNRFLGVLGLMVSSHNVNQTTETPDKEDTYFSGEAEATALVLALVGAVLEVVHPQRHVSSAGGTLHLHALVSTYWHAPVVVGGISMVTLSTFHSLLIQPALHGHCVHTAVHHQQHFGIRKSLKTRGQISFFILDYFSNCVFSSVSVLLRDSFDVLNH